CPEIPGELECLWDIRWMVKYAADSTRIHGRLNCELRWMNNMKE
ncbi:hypothetical protein scyTo_0018573, partial [Scyliorhinus torazame]|nr:hypothetical protein [Scyliorhinus torazame]